jgi:hypothetical protein
MTATGVTREVLEAAAAEVGVRAEIEPLSQSGTRHRVKLYPVPPPEAYTKGGRRRPGKRGDARWQRTSASAFNDDRRVNAVCWHGFRAFFRAVYRMEPHAIFRTAAATYKGAEHFEAIHPSTARRNIGSNFRPVNMGEACRCEAVGLHDDGGGATSMRARAASVTIMKQSDLLACPHCILVPEHYRADGTCRCRDATHGVMKEWGYTWKDGQWA